MRPRQSDDNVVTACVCSEAVFRSSGEQHSLRDAHLLLMNEQLLIRTSAVRCVLMNVDYGLGVCGMCQGCARNSDEGSPGEAGGFGHESYLAFAVTACGRVFSAC